MPTMPTITWNPPPLLLAGMLVDSALNAAAVDGSVPPVPIPGTFAYDPPAGTVVALNPTDPPFNAVPTSLTINLTFTPDDLGTYSVATAVATIALGTAYLIPSDARTLLAGLPAALVSQLSNQTDAQLISLLLTASQDIDVGMRYQGRKLLETQEREFPRLAYGPAPITRQFAMGYPGFFGLVYPFSADTKIWELDLTGATSGTVTAIVPLNIKLATIWQAAWILQPQFAQRLENIRSGLASQQIGTGAEAYVKGADLSDGFTGLGSRAIQLVSKYRLRAGRML
jgi:hypothetical protein